MVPINRYFFLVNRAEIIAEYHLQYVYKVEISQIFQ